MDPVRLTKISKFYNSTNYLNHAQPTWKNQIVSGKIIWISNSRPTDKTIEAEVHGNRAVQILQKYMVSFLVALYDGILESRIPFVITKIAVFKK